MCVRLCIYAVVSIVLELQQLHAKLFTMLLTVLLLFVHRGTSGDEHRHFFFVCVFDKNLVAS